MVYKNHNESWKLLKHWDRKQYVYNTLQQIWTPLWTCEQMRRVGTQEDGGKLICNLPYINYNPCIVYSFGINYETTFEKELKELAPHCQIFGFDPTPSVVDFYARSANSMPYLTFKPWGLSGADETGNMEGKPVILRSLTSIMSELGHTHLDILKIDIEYGEWHFFQTFFQTTFPVCQLTMEIHFNNHIDEEVEIMDKIRKKGFKMYYKEPNYIHYPALIEFAWVNEPLYFETEP